MNIRDVCIFKYPGQVEANNIGFGQDDDGSIFINKWDVAGIEQPTVEELEAEIPQYQRQFDVETFKSSVSSKVGALMNYTAKSKGLRVKPESANVVRPKLELGRKIQFIRTTVEVLLVSCQGPFCWVPGFVHSYLSFVQKKFT